ncbi:hypothetical protein KBC55_01415 [Patescibacteria group bacterium]|nr:hypothetical protein [Patescibacteria group bacterium]
MTYQIALRHNALESLYNTYRLCVEGKRLPADYNTTLDTLRSRAREYRLHKARSHLEHIENFQSGRTTHELLDDIERYMREFSLSFEEVDITEAAFKALRERCKPRIHPIVALYARAADNQPSYRHPRPR